MLLSVFPCQSVSRISISYRTHANDLCATMSISIMRTRARCQNERASV